MQVIFDLKLCRKGVIQAGPMPGARCLMTQRTACLYLLALRSNPPPLPPAYGGLSAMHVSDVSYESTSETISSNSRPRSPPHRSTGYTRSAHSRPCRLISRTRARKFTLSHYCRKTHTLTLVRESLRCRTIAGKLTYAR